LAHSGKAASSRKNADAPETPAEGDNSAAETTMGMPAIMPAEAAAMMTASQAEASGDAPVAEQPVTEYDGWTKAGKGGVWSWPPRPGIISTVRGGASKPADEPAAPEPEATETDQAEAATEATSESEAPADAASAAPMDENTIPKSAKSDKSTSEPVAESEAPGARPVIEPLATFQPIEPDAKPDTPADAATTDLPAVPEAETNAGLIAGPALLVPRAPAPPVVVTPMPPAMPTSRPTPAGRNKKPSNHRSRHARLRVSHIGILSLMRTALMFSVAIGIVLFIAIVALWMIIDNSGVLTNVQSIVDDLVGAGGTSGLQVSQYLDTQRVLGFAVAVTVLNIVLMTFFVTILGALYNAVAAILGGVTVTLSED